MRYGSVLRTGGWPASWWVLPLLAAGLTGGAAVAVERVEPPPPNVVVIISDDQAWTDYGFMGHPQIQTPHLDALAAESLVFERGYVTSPLCRPSLASMLTGRQPLQHRITGNDVDGRHNRAALDLPVRHAFSRFPTFVKALVAEGYMAHQSGKWWEGSWRDGGFTHGMTHGDPARAGRHGDEGLKIGREGMQPVLSFIDEAVKKTTPFLIWYAPFLPHTPHNPPADLLSEYRAVGMADDVAKYAAMCEWFDATCGELLEHLDRRAVADNTIVVFLADNGWAARSTNRQDPAQQAWSQFALKSKGSPYERGIRTPIMIRWPGKVPADRSPQLASAIDLFPTLAALTGCAMPADLPGINLTDPVATARRDVVFGVTHAIHNMAPEDPMATLQYLWCVERDWKLIHRVHGIDTTHYRAVHEWDQAADHLYNISTDPQETRDVADEQQAVVSRLQARIDHWQQHQAVSVEAAE